MEKVILELQITLPVYAATVLITQRTVMEKVENVTVVCTTPQVRLIIVSSALNLLYTPFNIIWDQKSFGMERGFKIIE